MIAKDKVSYLGTHPAQLAAVSGERMENKEKAGRINDDA